MKLYPAIDLMAGRCVRLAQGDFEAVTGYSDDPAATAKAFVTAGASFLHVVDLDGARAGRVAQCSLIGSLTQIGAQVQSGGGVRTENDLERLFAAGVTRVVVGSLAVKSPEKVSAWLARFGGERLTIALDVRLDDSGVPRVVTHGWQKSTGLGLEGALLPLLEAGLTHVLCTDVSRDGMLSGPNVALYQSLVRNFPKLQIQASGGVSSLDDLKALKAAGVAGTVLGKSLYEGRVRLEEAMALC